jgi:membrane protease YdiL (CAAX protease family)
VSIEFVSSYYWEGFLWGLWHLPLFAYAFPHKIEAHDSFLIQFSGYCFGLAFLSVVMTWIYNSTEGNLWYMLIFHSSLNASVFYFGMEKLDILFVYISIVCLPLLIVMCKIENQKIKD